jgi:hypothetical protein
MKKENLVGKETQKAAQLLTQDQQKGDSELTEKELGKVTGGNTPLYTPETVSGRRVQKLVK